MSSLHDPKTLPGLRPGGQDRANQGAKSALKLNKNKRRRWSVAKGERQAIYGHSDVVRVSFGEVSQGGEQPDQLARVGLLGVCHDLHSRYGPPKRSCAMNNKRPRQRGAYRQTTRHAWTNRWFAASWLLLGVMVSVAQAVPPVITEHDGPLGEMLLQMGGDGFEVTRADHFILSSDLPRDVLDPMIEAAEATYAQVWQFSRRLGLPLSPPQWRLPVMMFGTSAGFDRHTTTVNYTAPSASGFYDAGTNIAVFHHILDHPDVRRISAQMDALRKPSNKPGERKPTAATTPADKRLQQRIAALVAERDQLVDTFNRLILHHEVAHQVMYNIGTTARPAHHPSWLVEGLAMLFEPGTPQATEGTIPINLLRLADLRNALGVRPGDRQIEKDAYDRAFETQRLLPLAELIQNDDTLLPTDPNAALRYAQAWGLVYYLQQKRPEALGKYLRDLNGRSDRTSPKPSDAKKAFEARFGPIDARFQRIWVDFIVKIAIAPAGSGK